MTRRRPAPTGYCVQYGTRDGPMRHMHTDPEMARMQARLLSTGVCGATWARAYAVHAGALLIELPTPDNNEVAA